MEIRSFSQRKLFQSVLRGLSQDWSWSGAKLGLMFQADSEKQGKSILLRTFIAGDKLLDNYSEFRARLMATASSRLHHVLATAKLTFTIRDNGNVSRVNDTTGTFKTRKSNSSYITIIFFQTFQACASFTQRMK